MFQVWTEALWKWLSMVKKSCSLAQEFDETVRKWREDKFTENVQAWSASEWPICGIWPCLYQRMAVSSIGHLIRGHGNTKWRGKGDARYKVHEDKKNKGECTLGHGYPWSDWNDFTFSLGQLDQGACDQYLSMWPLAGVAKVLNPFHLVPWQVALRSWRRLWLTLTVEIS